MWYVLFNKGYSFQSRCPPCPPLPLLNSKDACLVWHYRFVLTFMPPFDGLLGFLYSSKCPGMPPVAWPVM